MLNKNVKQLNKNNRKFNSIMNQKWLIDQIK